MYGYMDIQVQGRDCSFTLCYASLKMSIILIEAVCVTRYCNHQGSNPVSIYGIVFLIHARFVCYDFWDTARRQMLLLIENGRFGNSAVMIFGSNEYSC